MDNVNQEEIDNVNLEEMNNVNWEEMNNVNWWEEMDNVNWEDLATYILESEKDLVARNYPPPAPALLTWKHDIYLGSIQEVAPNLSNEIVLLSKSTYKLPSELVAAIRKLDQKRLELVADESLDLGGRQHILRRLEDKLVYMTSEQTEYMTNNLPDIMEIQNVSYLFDNRIRWYISPFETPIWPDWSFVP